ncbi:hypothetical protein NEOKW01_1769 [Nematocida sp. AWRm80]|nr:hypothetical protein NEOKW01_1769 [Nematocida sp. AWRm80]
MPQKESLLEKLKKQKSFLENTNESTGSQLKFNEPYLVKKEEEKKVSNPIIPPENSYSNDPNTLFSKESTLYEKQDNSWTERAKGIIIAINRGSTGVQLIFQLENTRIILNALILEKNRVNANKDCIIFLGTAENKPYIGCLRLKTDAEAEQAAEAIKKVLK